MNCKNSVKSTDLYCASCGEKVVRDNKKYILIVILLLLCNIILSFVVSKKIVYFIRNNYNRVDENRMQENIQNIPNYDYPDDYQFNDDFFNDFFGY